MKIGLRDYQERVLEELSTIQDKEKCLAACPGAGKTVMALHLAERLEGNVLILPHGTDVLRTNFIERAEKFNVDYCRDFSKKITIELPQTIKRRSIPKINTIIVDEAHERTLGKEFEEIVKKANPDQIIHLTGTPSKLLARNIKCAVVPMMEISDYFAKLNLQIAEASFELNESDFNADGEVKENVGVSYTQESMNNVMDALVKHCKLKGNFRWYKKINPFNQLGKTMIACRNEEQLRQVAAYLEVKGTKFVVSISKDDKDSEGFKVFQEDKDTEVLLVLRRGILGFDMTELSCFVDMTASRNIDGIYQKLARVVRKDEANSQKLFVKVAPKGQVDMYEYYTCAALMLTSREGLLSYTGKTRTALVPRLEPRKKRAGRENTGTRSKPTSIKWGDEMDVINFFKRCYHNIHEEYAVVGKTNLARIKAQLEGKQFEYGYWNSYDNILKFCRDKHIINFTDLTTRSISAATSVSRHKWSQRLNRDMGWNTSRCSLEEAKEFCIKNKITSGRDLQKTNPAIFKAIYDNKWQNIFYEENIWRKSCPDMVFLGSITYEEILQKCQSDEKVTGLAELYKLHSGYYNALRHFKWQRRLSDDMGWRYVGWSEEEENVIRELYGKKTSKEIGEVLGRSTKSVSRKIRAMKDKKLTIKQNDVI